MASALLCAAPSVGLLLVTEAAQALIYAPLEDVLSRQMLTSSAERPDTPDAAAIGMLTAF